MPLADRPHASANCRADRNWPWRSASAAVAASINGFWVEYEYFETNCGCD
jgi:hypothetical protein